ncbi:MAG: hypothetical protein IT210_23415 [Armatimonadetes bacterium]|nr:hypothetical protein [Armatimonadota bacterium]
MDRAMPFLEPISFSGEALTLCAKRAPGEAVSIYYREIQANTCCGIAVDIRPIWEKKAALEADPDYLPVESREGVPIYVHRSLVPFLRRHSLRIAAKGWGRFKWLRIESDVDIEKWCIFGEGI